MILAHECRFFARAAYHMLSNGGSPREVAPPPKTPRARGMLIDLEKAHRFGDVAENVARLADVYGVEV